MAKRITIETKNELFDSSILQKGEREGIPIDKGFTLNQAWAEKNEELLRVYMDYFIMYPDMFLDLIKPKDDGFSLFYYQRIMLRAMMRYKDVYIVACRAASKSFITIIAMFLQCVFIPRHKDFICAPFKKQGAQIAKEKLTEIYQHYPLLAKEVIGYELKPDCPGNFGSDYVTIKFRSNGQFDVVGAGDSTRGGRRHSGLLDELRGKIR